MNSRLTLLGLAFGILLALLIAPQTRWLVRSQIVPPSLLAGRYGQQKRQFVRQHPGDYQVQLAGQPDGTAQTQLQYARSLVPRFPGNVSLRANILRYAMANLHVQRDEDELLSGQPVPAYKANPANLPPTPAELAAFESDAAAGERLDPDNAYFPWMRSVGYFAVHRDAEGLAAVQRASKKHRWREYYSDEVVGHWRINDRIYGGREAVSSMAVSAAVLFPHFQFLRQVARVVTYKAILEEQAGHAEAGLALRRQMMRCGELMTVQSPSLIGSLVGIAICSVARGRPGGSEPVTANPSLTNEQRAEQRLAAYCTYVTRIGHPEAAAEAQVQFQTWQQVQRITAHVGDYTFAGSLSDLMHLAIALAVDWVAVPNIINLLLLGLLATALSRLPQVRQRLPLPPGTAAGVWMALLLASALAATLISAAGSDFIAFAALLVSPPLAIVLLTAVLLPHLRPALFQALKIALITGIILGLYGTFMAWLMHGGADPITTLRETLSLPGSDPNDSSAPSDAKIGQIQRGVGLLFGLAFPLLLAIILSVAACVRRVPVSAGLVEGFRLWTPPLICVLMFAYGGLVLWTVRQERQINYGLEQSLQSEGRHYAQMMGQPWPGTAR